MPNDIVYVLKNDISDYELKYSLRSVCKNFIFRNIWFYGGCPDTIQPDHYIDFYQLGDNKWLKTRSMYVDIFTNPEITEDFYLFNDDFYIMRPYAQDIPKTNGSLYKQIQRIEKRNYNRQSAYTKRLNVTMNMLRSKRLDIISYETHTPFLVNRRKGMDLCREFDERYIFRSTYGNIYDIGGILEKDNKLCRVDDIPPIDVDVLSSTDTTFKNGRLGEYIRAVFNEPCRYEL